MPNISIEVLKPSYVGKAISYIMYMVSYPNGNTIELNRTGDTPSTSKGITNNQDGKRSYLKTTSHSKYNGRFGPALQGLYDIGEADRERERNKAIPLESSSHVPTKLTVLCYLTQMFTILVIERFIVMK